LKPIISAKETVIMKKIRIISCILLLAMAASFLGSCSSSDLTKTITPQKIEPVPISEYENEDNARIATLGQKLLAELYTEDENVIISPLSIMLAMSMTANGARGDTLSQMSGVLFGESSVEDENVYLHSLLDSLSKKTENELMIANSVWIRDEKDRLTVKEDCLQKIVDYYSAQVFKAPFDNSTVGEINKWVSNATKGKIDKMVEEIPSEAVMYLLNTVYFDGAWDSPYEKHSVKQGIFHSAKGDRSVRMMTDTEDYVDDEMAKGFVKYYKKSEYAFVAMLPNEGVSLEEYINELDVEKLLEGIKDPKGRVIASIPQFEYEYSTSLVSAFKALGITYAFDGVGADFSNLATSKAGNIFISEIDHKCTIKLDENGTCASAATKVELNDGGAIIDYEKIVFDRPFLYMIVDKETANPLFIGTIVDIK